MCREAWMHPLRASQRAYLLIAVLFLLSTYFAVFAVDRVGLEKVHKGMICIKV